MILAPILGASILKKNQGKLTITLKETLIKSEFPVAQGGATKIDWCNQLIFEQTKNRIFSLRPLISPGWT